MQTCCLSCKKHTDNVGSKDVTMTNRVVREKSKCVNAMIYTSRFLKEKPNKKTSWNNVNPSLFLY